MSEEDDSCYCGWLGDEPPTLDVSSADCYCVIGQNIDPNHGHDIGYMIFQEKLQNPPHLREIYLLIKMMEEKGHPQLLYSVGDDYE